VIGPSALLRTQRSYAGRKLKRGDRSGLGAEVVVIRKVVSTAWVGHEE